MVGIGLNIPVEIMVWPDIAKLLAAPGATHRIKIRNTIDTGPPSCVEKDWKSRYRGKDRKESRQNTNRNLFEIQQPQNGDLEYFDGGWRTTRCPRPAPRYDRQERKSDTSSVLADADAKREEDRVTRGTHQTLP